MLENLAILKWAVFQFQMLRYFDWIHLCSAVYHHILREKGRAQYSIFRLPGNIHRSKSMNYVNQAEKVASHPQAFCCVEGANLDSSKWHNRSWDESYQEIMQYCKCCVYFISQTAKSSKFDTKEKNLILR